MLQGRERWPWVILNLIGVLNIVFAVLGLLYNGLTLSLFTFNFEMVRGMLLKNYPEYSFEKIPYFFQSFYVMSAICVVTYVLLLIGGVGLLKKRLAWCKVLIALYVFELIYRNAPHRMWDHPVYGNSIAAATGVANGGLSPQFFVGFPIWAILFLVFAWLVYDKQS